MALNPKPYPLRENPRLFEVRVQLRGIVGRRPLGVQLELDTNLVLRAHLLEQRRRPRCRLQPAKGPQLLLPASARTMILSEQRQYRVAQRELRLRDVASDE